MYHGQILVVDGVTYMVTQVSVNNATPTVPVDLVDNFHKALSQRIGKFEDALDRFARMERAMRYDLPQEVFPWRVYRRPEVARVLGRLPRRTRARRVTPRAASALSVTQRRRHKHRRWVQAMRRGATGTASG